MATYVYKCKSCGEPFEISRSMFATSGPVECPHCHGSDTYKVPTAPGVILDWKDWDGKGVVVGPDRYRGPAVPQSVA